MSFRRLQVVSSPSAPPLNGSSSAGDIGLLVFLLGVHLALLGGFFIGVGWGDAVAGYSTAVVLLVGRELVRELAHRLWNRNETRRS